MSLDLRVGLAVGLLAVALGGCSASSEVDGEGDSCETTADCESDLLCIDGTCESAGDGGFDGGTGDAGGDAGEDCPATLQCGETCCETGQVCGDGVCCAPSELCGGACCTGSERCVADACVLDCSEEETPCGSGASATCCGAVDVCYLGECTTPGDTCETGRDCPDDHYCETSLMRCLPRAEGEECEYRPPVGPLEIEEEWSWSGDSDVLSGYDQIMMAPMVANLDDDNGDGAIDEHDVPDVVFHTFTGSAYTEDGILRAIEGDGGARLWPTSDPGYRTTPGSEIAIGDVLPGSPGPEIAACSSPRSSGHLLLLSATGELLQRFDTAPNDVPCGLDAPAIGDMDGDGTPEIVVRWVIAHADGTVVERIRDERGGSGPYNTLADIDDDPDLELVGPNGAYDMDGTPVWERTVDEAGRPAIDNATRAYVAVADLDEDDEPEVIVVTHGDHAIRMLDAGTGDTDWGPIDINPPELADDVAAEGPQGGGPPTIANFDDDSAPEIAFAGGFAYVIFEADGSRKWYFETRDRSSRSTGSSLFDFEGDGIAEVLYNDEYTFRVYRGPDGMVLDDRCNTSGTITEYPIVVDVDNDDNAEVVLMENNYSRDCLDGSGSGTGIHVFGHPRGEWVRTRRIWNQHTYHVTNVNEDGTIPTREEPNWTVDGLNNFRQNVQPDGLFDAPDLVLRDLHASNSGCPSELVLSVRVVNRGAAGAPADVPVTFYEGDGASRTVIGRARTTRALLPGESEVLVLDPPYSIPSDRTEDTFVFSAELNDPDDMPLETLHECRPDNNAAGPLEAACPTVE